MKIHSNINAFFSRLMLHTINLSIWEAVSGGSLQVQGLPCLHNDFQTTLNTQEEPPSLKKNSFLKISLLKKILTGG